MKKIVVALGIVIFAIVLMTSCNKDVCPAYESSNTEIVKNKG
jgi:hypothetical protein